MLRRAAALSLLLPLAACSPSTTTSAEHPRSRLAKQTDTLNQEEVETKKDKQQRLVAPPPAYGNRVVEVQPVDPVVAQTPTG